MDHGQRPTAHVPRTTDHRPKSANVCSAPLPDFRFRFWPNKKRKLFNTPKDTFGPPIPLARMCAPQNAKTITKTLLPGVGGPAPPPSARNPPENSTPACKCGKFSQAQLYAVFFLARHARHPSRSLLVAFYWLFVGISLAFF